MVLSIVQWRDGLLPVLSALTIALIIEVATEAGTVDFYNASTAIYGVVVLVIVASWFLLRRRRVSLQHAKPPTAENGDRLRAAAQRTAPDAPKPRRADS